MYDHESDFGTSRVLYTCEEPITRRIVKASSCMCSESVELSCQRTARVNGARRDGDIGKRRKDHFLLEPSPADRGFASKLSQACRAISKRAAADEPRRPAKPQRRLAFSDSESSKGPQFSSSNPCSTVKTLETLLPVPKMSRHHDEEDELALNSILVDPHPNADLQAASNPNVDPSLAHGGPSSALNGPPVLKKAAVTRSALHNMLFLKVCSHFSQDFYGLRWSVASEITEREALTIRTGCRTRKYRCNGEMPCANCVRSKVACVYTPNKRSRRTKPEPCVRSPCFEA